MGTAHKPRFPRPSPRGRARRLTRRGAGADSFGACLRRRLGASEIGVGTALLTGAVELPFLSQPRARHEGLQRSVEGEVREQSEDITRAAV
jgi:hypothetical protein